MLLMVVTKKDGKFVVDEDSVHHFEPEPETRGIYENGVSFGLKVESIEPIEEE